MSHVLSIIVPSYNSVESLPALLDSVEAQTFIDYEVLVMDDCSDQFYDDVITDYINKGMAIRLIRNSSRQYTKESRLRGIEASQGDLITFVDADDSLVGTEVLKYHVEMMIKEKADLLHFGMAAYQNGKIFRQMYEWARPFADKLDKREILNAYIENKMAGHSVCAKIATRELWIKCLDPARAIPIRRYAEDQLLCSLLFVHASSYIGSERIGYRYDYIDKTKQKACGRSVAAYLMLRDFLPYVTGLGINSYVINKMKEKFERNLIDNVLSFMSQASVKTNEDNLNTYLDEIKQHIDPVDYLKAIMRSQVFQ